MGRPGFIQELARGFSALTVETEGDDLEFRRAEFLLKRIEFGHFLPAGRTPSRPKVQ